MKKAEIYGKTIKITNKDHKQLLKRFNLKNFIFYNRRSENYPNMYVNITPCPLCNKYIDFFCICCPLKQFEGDYKKYRYGCHVIVSKFIYSKTKKNISFNVGNVVGYNNGRLIEAEKEIKMIYNFLLRRFKDVKK